MSDEGFEDSVHIAVGWNDEYDQPYVALADEGDYEDSAEVFEADVPASLWATLDEAEKRYDAAIAAVCEAVGFEDGCLRVCCPEWQGEVSGARTWWSVVLSASGDDQHWPLHDADITTFNTYDEARAFVSSLPEEFYVHAYGAALEPVRRDRLSVERGGFGPSVSACHRCGWERDEHP